MTNPGPRSLVFGARQGAQNPLGTQFPIKMTLITMAIFAHIAMSLHLRPENFLQCVVSDTHIFGEGLVEPTFGHGI